ncbi:MAG: SRPBCC family protein [Thermostichus sp. DG02_5_bins_236]
MLLPSQATASRSAELKASPARVFQTVTNIEEQAAWRKDIKAVSMHSSGKSWTEETTTGTIIDFEVRRKEPNTRFEIEFVSKQGFSGSWVGVFIPSSDGTTVQITEMIEIQNPIFRVMSRIFGFTDKFIDTYLTQLKEAVEN